MPFQSPSSLSERTLSDKTAYHKSVETVENHLFTTRRLSIIRLLRQTASGLDFGRNSGRFSVPKGPNVKSAKLLIMSGM